MTWKLFWQMFSIVAACFFGYFSGLIIKIDFVLFLKVWISAAAWVVATSAIGLCSLKEIRRLI